MTVVPIRAVVPNSQSENAAWSVLVALQRYALDNPNLLESDYYREQLRIAHERWSKIFLQ